MLSGVLSCAGEVDHVTPTNIYYDELQIYDFFVNPAYLYDVQNRCSMFTL